MHKFVYFICKEYLVMQSKLLDHSFVIQHECAASEGFL